MTPEEHYTAAVRLLRSAKTRCDRGLRVEDLAEAQVHATLALYQPDRPGWTADYPVPSTWPAMVTPPPAVDKALLEDS